MARAQYSSALSSSSAIMQRRARAMQTSASPSKAESSSEESASEDLFGGALLIQTPARRPEVGYSQTTLGRELESPVPVSQQKVSEYLIAPCEFVLRSEADSVQEVASCILDAVFPKSDGAVIGGDPKSLAIARKVPPSIYCLEHDCSFSKLTPVHQIPGFIDLVVNHISSYNVRQTGD